jgi:Cu(I)/Ag(I) efflux system membrane fusion protein
VNYEPYDDEPKPPRVSRLRKIAANLGWLIGGAVLAILLVADPLGIHPVDDWLHRAFGHRASEMTEHPKPAGSMQGMKPGSMQGAQPSGERKILFYRNPMDPTITSPVPMKDSMGMDYVPVYADEAQQAKSAGERKILFYRNPMDPTITSPVPMKDSMGMDYVPVYADEAQQAGSSGTDIRIDPSVVQNMNVVSAPVERRDLTREIRTVGYLDYDQQKMVSVTTKYSGFIEKVYANYIGEPVRRGAPLFEIYSPELVQSQEELLSAIAYTKRLADAPADARQRADALADAARTRLAFWDISDDQIQRLESSGKVQRTLTVTAPASGVLMMRMPGLEGMAVKPGMELFHIADLSTLWLSVEVFEDQLSWLRQGSEAAVSLAYFPGEVFHGRVRFVEPQVEEKTRTVGLRIEVPNPDGRLRAGMYATVRFSPVLAHDAVVVPSQAVLRTGERNLVVLALGQGRFEPRQVELGPEGDHYIQVLSGLQPGQKVVTSAQFLLDSESNLQAAIQNLVAKAKEAPDAH